VEDKMTKKHIAPFETMTFEQARQRADAVLGESIPLDRASTLVVHALTPWIDHRLIVALDVLHPGWEHLRAARVVIELRKAPGGKCYLWCTLDDKGFRREFAALCAALEESAQRPSIPIPQTIEERREQVAKLYAQGLTDRDMAARLCVCTKTIQRDREAKGLPKR
jgi:hypothetical protein